MSRPAGPARDATAPLVAIVLVVLVAALVATVFVALAGIALTGLGWSELPLSDSIANAGDAASSIAYAVLGTLIVRRAANLTAGSCWPAAWPVPLWRPARPTRSSA